MVVAVPVLVVDDGDDAGGEEEREPDDVDHQLEDGQVSAEQVREENGWHDDGEADEGAVREEVVAVGAHWKRVGAVTVAETGQKQANQD